MTQQPFSRPGAVDLSGLTRPPAGAGQGVPAGEGGAAGGGSSYWLDVTQENFQATVEASLTAPVLLAFHSPSRLPESTQMARDLATVAGAVERVVVNGCPTQRVLQVEHEWNRRDSDSRRSTA